MLHTGSFGYARRSAEEEGDFREERTHRKHSSLAPFRVRSLMNIDTLAAPQFLACRRDPEIGEKGLLLAGSTLRGACLE